MNQTQFIQTWHDFFWEPAEFDVFFIWVLVNLFIIMTLLLWESYRVRGD